MREQDEELKGEEIKPGPIWGGWWCWEPTTGKTMESPEDTFRRLNPTLSEEPQRTA